MTAIILPYQTPGVAQDPGPAQYYSGAAEGAGLGHAAKATEDLLTSSRNHRGHGAVAPALGGFNPVHCGNTRC